jgi:hypothetical protein
MKYLKIIIFAVIFLSGYRTAYAAITIRPMLNTGLVGYWSMDEGAGTIANDQSGYRNNGAITDSTWADGKIGKALLFDGSSGNVDVGLGSSLKITGSITVSAWVNLTSINAAGTDDDIFSKSQSGNDFCWQLKGTEDCGSETIGLMISADGTTYGQRCGTTTLSIATWYHIAGVYNVAAQTIDVYLNGVLDNGTLVNSVPSSIYNPDIPPTIGNRYSGGEATHGTIDEVRIYNRAMSAGEIKRLYNLTKPKILSANTIGLVGYWSFDEGLGTKAGDMSGWGNNGTASGSPAWVEGKRGKALSFDGSSDNVSLPDPGTDSIFDITNELSIFAWIKPNELNGYNVIVEKQNIAGTDYSYIFDTYDNELFFDAYDGANPAVTTNNANLEAGQWYYVGVVFSWDQDTIKFYKNGVEIYQYIGLPNLIIPNNVPIYMGGNSHDGGVYFGGPIDEVRVYNRALSATEVANLYGASKKIIKLNTSQNTKLTDGLVGMWSFNGPDISGSIAFDRSGSGNNGTITGATIINGKVGQALKFNGTSNYISLANDSVATNTITACAWIYPKILDDWRTIMGNDKFIFGPYNTSEGLILTSDGGSTVQVFSDDYVLKINQWQHACAVRFSNGSGTIYLNGSQTGGTGSTGAPDIVAGGLAIGASRSAAGRTGYFNGYLDEVRLYNRALSVAEIKRLYEMGK